MGPPGLPLISAAWSPSGAQALEASPNSLAPTQQQSKESRARFRELDKAQGDLRRERRKSEDAIEASRRHSLARQRAEERLRQARRALAAATAGDGPAPEWLQQLVLVLSQEQDDEADALPVSATSSDAHALPASDQVDALAASEASATLAPESRRCSTASDGVLEHRPDPQGQTGEVPPLPRKLFEERAATAASPLATSAACADEEPAPEPLELDVQPWHATTMRSPSAFAEGTASQYEGKPSPYDSVASQRTASWQPDSDVCQSCRGRFTFATRRHHCRECGSCICASCSPFRVYLEAPLADGRRQPVALQKGGVHRACWGCRGAAETPEP